MTLNRARAVILPAAALAAFCVTAWIDTLRGNDVDRDDLLPAILTIVLATWALTDFYYRKLTRDRKQALAGRDLEALAHGVAAYVARSGDSEDPGQHVPGKHSPGC